MLNELPVILHDTDRWLVLNKPASWHTVARRGGNTDSPATPDVESWLRRMDGLPWARELEEAGLVHRLDQETGGCLLVAKSAAEQQRLRAAFQSGAGVRKVYRAILSFSGALAERGTFRLFFTSRYKRSKKVTVRTEGEARHEGRCAWRVVRPGAVASPRGDLVDVELVGPGRRHQIRAGFAHLDRPLLGDALYGGPAWPPGLALHAARLEVDGAVIECPMPATWGIGRDVGDGD